MYTNTSRLFLLLLFLLLLLPTFPAKQKHTSGQQPRQLSKSCTKSLPSSLSKETREALCTEPLLPSISVLKECVKNVSKSGGKESEIIALCSGVPSSRPGECYSNLKSFSDKDRRWKTSVCASASDSSDVEGCVRGVKGGVKKDGEGYIVSLCSGEGVGKETAECGNLLSKSGSFSKEEIVKICGGTNSLDPAVCSSSKLISSLPPPLISHLCSRSPSPTSPAQCYRLAPSYLSPESLVELCAGSPLDSVATGRAECAQALDQKIRRTLTPQEMVRLCKGAQPEAPRGPGECASKFLSKGSKKAEKRVVDLCAGAENAYPAKCFEEAGKILKDEGLQVEVCRKGDGKGEKVKCLKELPYELSSIAKAKVCGGADASSSPQACANELWKSGDSVVVGGVSSSSTKESIILSMCSPENGRGGGKGVEAAICYLNAPRNYSPSEKESLCSSDLVVSGLYAARCASLATPLEARLGRDLILTLCASAPPSTTTPSTSDRNLPGPISCALSAPFGFSRSDILALCVGPPSNSPSLCAGRLPPNFPPPLSARLCKTGNLVSADCVEHLPQSFSHADAIEICEGATTLTPAYCARSMRGGGRGEKWEEEIRACTGAVSRPTRLEVREINFSGSSLLPGTLIHVSVSLHDQYSQPLTWDNSTVVVASLDPGGTDGAVLSGTRANFTLNGVASFHTLSVDKEGNFTVRFQVSSSAPGDESPGDEQVRADVAVGLRVGSDPASRMMQGVCSGLYESFGSFTGPPPGKLNIMESMSVIPFPESLRKIQCLDILSAAGFTVTHGWGGDVWLWSMASIEQMGTGVDLITPEMSYWDRLGVDVGASRGERRRAYHKKSLLWHPDRWVQFPHYKSKAAEVFDLIVEAYEMLNKGEEEGEEGEEDNPAQHTDTE